MQRACPSVCSAELPHHVPSTTNVFGSVYDVTYIAPEFSAHKFERPKTSGYARNANPVLGNAAIDLGSGKTTTTTKKKGGKERKKGKKLSLVQLIT